MASRTPGANRAAARNGRWRFEATNKEPGPYFSTCAFLAALISLCAVSYCSTVTPAILAASSRFSGCGRPSPGTSKTYFNFSEYAIARLPGSVHGVVVQITTDALRHASLSLSASSGVAPVPITGNPLFVPTTGNFTHTVSLV